MRVFGRDGPNDSSTQPLPEGNSSAEQPLPALFNMQKLLTPTWNVPKHPLFKLQAGSSGIELHIHYLASDLNQDDPEAKVDCLSCPSFSGAVSKPSTKLIAPCSTNLT